ncbi:hypothetical protein [Actinotalea subterranea]|uniref:hypothetical protein n=1 Tax=Actinotalea subterranea TaxID=2607497 RepID=UPI00165E47F1|nr:hypothetical protein [Actinotalea subterranea]
MSTTTHTCVYFDDGEIELLCTCGQRALLVLDEDGTDGTLVVLLDEDGSTTFELAATA